MRIYDSDNWYTIDQLPQLTGLSIATIFRILEANWNFFHVIISSYPKPDSCRLSSISMQCCYEVFLKDEVRSKDLYVTYLSSVVHALKSRIAYTKSAEGWVLHSWIYGQRTDALVLMIPLNSSDRLGAIFLSFFRHGWDIQIDRDLQKHSAMWEVIELLLNNSPILPKSLMLYSGLEIHSDEFYAIRESHVTLQWLIKQLCVSLYSHI